MVGQQPPKALLGRPTTHRPTATTLKLKTLLDGTKKKRRKPQQRKPPQRTSPPRSHHAVATTTTTSTDIFGTSGKSLAELHTERKQKTAFAKHAATTQSTTSVRPNSSRRPLATTAHRPARVSIRPPPTLRRSTVDTTRTTTKSVTGKRERSIVDTVATTTTTTTPHRFTHKRPRRDDAVASHGVGNAADTEAKPFLDAVATRGSPLTHGPPQAVSATAETSIVPETVPTEATTLAKPSLALSKRNTCRLIERHAETQFASHTVATTNETRDSTRAPPATRLSSQPNASTAHFPRLVSKETKQQQQPKANYVRLNMKNAAGACRFHRKPTKAKRDYYHKSNDQDERRPTLPAATTIDPVDDYLDGVYTTKQQQPSKKKKKASSSSSIPLCSGHHQPCIRRIVKKAGPNRGRAFFVCPCQPRSEQCPHFSWADDTSDAARAVLLQNTSVSGFLARHVEAYRQRMALYTVPELKTLLERQGLDSTGNKAALRTRLAVWVRDELVAGLGGTDEGEGTENDAMGEEPDTVPEETKAVSDAEASDDDEPMECSSEKGAKPATMASHENQRIPMIQGASNQFVELDDDSSDEESDEEDCSFEASTSATNVSCKPSAALCTAGSPNDNSSPRSILRAQFGFDDFREGQEWAVNRCLAQQRSLLVAPTGSGKSLCYALPASMTKGVCIVVSPLLSLIDDQIRHLPVRLAATTLSGPMTAASTAATVDDVVRGRIRILFVSPERLTSASFRRLFRPRWNNETKTYEKTFPTVSLLCVDEAHTLSQWAHNFRPSYLRLQSIVKLMQPQSVLALTATAGPRVVDDICQSLNIPRGDPNKDGGVVALATNRDNIDVKCVFLESQEERLDKLIKVLSKPASKSKAATSKNDEHNGTLAKGSVIVYVWRQRDAEIVAENISGSEISGGVVVYHGGMDSAKRQRSQSKFMRGKARICVATVAFGLGINKPDVAGVIHLYLSSSPEHYIQEIGRAGRDGRPSKALALVLRDEIYVRHSLANSDRIALSQVESLISALNERLQSAIRVLPPHRSKELPVCICFPLAASETRSGFKPETAETLLSMMEQRGDGLPLLTIEGVSYDAATISPIKCRLEELAEKESVVQALSLCCKCVDPPLGGNRGSELDTDRGSAGGHSFGSYSFSVSECCNCLGENAEPRHVFAALRRLEQTGAVDFFLQSSPRDRVLSLQLSVHGMESLRCENFIKDLATEVFERFHTTVSSGESKVAHLHNILSHVSELEDDDTEPRTGQDGNKSQSLVVFQEEVNKYFESESNNSEEAKEPAAVDSPFETNISQVELARDAQTALTYIAEIQSSSPDSSSHAALNIGDPNIPDYTALVVTKFLHGLAPHSMAYSLLRHHPLFGRYQRVQFSSVLSSVRLIFRVEVTHA